MFVIEVMPLGRGMPLAGLSYFSKDPYPRGTLLSIPIRKKIGQGVVMSSEPVPLAKAAVRSAGFLLRRLPSQETVESLSPSLLAAVEELAEYYASRPGAVLFSLLPKEIKNGTVPILIPEKGDPAGEYSYEVFQTLEEERIIAYRSLVRSSFAEHKSIVFAAPTIASAEYLFATLADGIPGRAFLLHGEAGAKKIRSAYAALGERTHPVLIVATPQYAFLSAEGAGTVILEHSRSFGYRAHERPYLDFRHAFAVLARRRGLRLITADTLIRTEDEFLLRAPPEAEPPAGYARGALPFDEHPKRLALAGTLKVLPMRETPDGHTLFPLFSDILFEQIEKIRTARGRTFIFCARRGLAPVVVCLDCGEILRDPQSGSPLALHRSAPAPGGSGREERWLVSSVSGYRRRTDDLCPHCGSWRLRERGIGIQHVYDELVKILGEKDIFLFDHQTASTHKKGAAIIEQFYARRKTILLGTALALPYLHAPVQLSAVVSLDALRAIPSWRQEEESLGILLALREKTHGFVFVQTRSEEHELLRHARSGTTGAYYAEELVSRRQFHYPPYSVFIHLTWHKGEPDMLTPEITERLGPFDIALYGPPSDNEKIGYGLLRVPHEEWPRDDIVDALRALPPSVRVIINPDRIV